MYAYFFDYSAISVLLGEAWKSLPIEEREAYSTKAKVLADEQKKIHPDCWKRKKTVANNTATNANVNQSGTGEMTNKTTSTSHNLINSISTSHQKIAPPTSNVTLPLPVSLPPPVIPILSETAQRVVGSSQSTVDIV